MFKLKDFFKTEQGGGIILILCTVFSMVLANSHFQVQYLAFWEFKIAGHSLMQWTNDGLMTIFFLQIGLELEREIYLGEFAEIKNAILPISAALGGMLIPAAIFFSINYGEDTQAGAGIPMATDIAFALAILSLLGNRVPATLKMFLTALAVVDDLGAIIIIALFYSHDFNFINLGLALLITLILFILNRKKVYVLPIYLVGGLALWYFMLSSGIHASIAGVVLAFLVPFVRGDYTSPSYRLMKFLHYPVAFIVLPIFALANTSIVFENGWYNGIIHSGSIGIALGLIIGKPIGIFLFSYISVYLGFCKLPASLNFKRILGVGFLGGIGFTMSIFIDLLAFSGSMPLITSCKIAVIISSIIAAIIGIFYLKKVL